MVWWRLLDKGSGPGSLWQMKELLGQATGSVGTHAQATTSCSLVWLTNALGKLDEW